MKGLLATLPCLYADDTSTLLSLRSKSTLESGAENFMRVVEERNVTQMASMLQNLAKSQLFGDGVTGDAASGEINLDSDIKEALKTIKQLLLGDIQSALKREHAVDQKAVNILHKCWDDCKVDRGEDQHQVDELWGVMQSHKTRHETCRKDVHAKYIVKITKCNALDIWVKSLKCPECVKEECTVIRDPSSRNIGDMLQSHLTWATSSWDEWKVKHTACVKAVQEYNVADTQCDVTQGDFETGTCAHRQAEWTACNVNEMTCCARCSKEFDIEVNRVECAEKDRKIDWSATKKIECYIDVLMASPTDEELAAKCNKDGKACINQWRENKYNECSFVCSEVDFETGDYSVVRGVNTTHRSAYSDGDRCTVHLDIHFPNQGKCTKCPPPGPGPCGNAFISTYYAEYDLTLTVPGLENENECHPDVHQKWWAYSRAECRPCPSLIGRSPMIVEDDCTGWSVVDMEESLIQQAASMSPKPTSALCPEGVECVGGTDRAYFVNRADLNIDGQRRWCESHNGKLASIHTSEDNEAVMALLAGKSAWIGALKTGTTWAWEDGDTWTSPDSERISNDGLSNHQRETRICIHSDRRWHDWNHGEQGKGGVCEIKTPPAPKLCPDGVECVVGTDRAYFVNRADLNIDGQRRWCESHNGDLASIHTSEDNEAVMGLLAGKSAWIGALKTGTTWAWEDGDTWTSPDSERISNDGLSNHQHETRICIHSDRRWHDWNHGEQAKGGVCEIKAVSDEFKHDVDGTCYVAAFTINQWPSKTFTGLNPGCTYKMSAVIDTLASTDNEPMQFSVNGHVNNFGGRHGGSCNNGWSAHPHGFGVQLGSPGSANHGWPDCYKRFSSHPFTATPGGLAHVEMHIAVNQHISDEAWGWHSMKIEEISCGIGDVVVQR